MNEALYRVLKNLISKGQIDGMEKKLDVFYAADKITEEQYVELNKMLAEAEQNQKKENQQNF